MVEVFLKWGLLLKERICSNGSKFFSLTVDPNEMGGRNENDRVASPVYPSTLSVLKGNTPILKDNSRLAYVYESQEVCCYFGW